MRYGLSRASRGVTLLEVMATMAVMLLGVAAVMTLVTHISTSNRRTLTATQAQLIAERRLENIASMGCSAEPPCSNLAGLDNQRTKMWQTAQGDLLTVAPAAGVVAREYEVAVDVDYSRVPGSIEGGSRGSPDIARDLVPGQAGSIGNLVNVRVSVSWLEPGRTGRQVVVMQTRVAP
ncbi:type II secretion system protein [Myxococcus llanfairpwllgwyngyllgogerychwyrndrobwllllantysiliogogogochensis]|uniref:Type II secretion system protein n=1 Tax=Myxococcus llanfairpwllgwyngyllgogerychwyrndrobwllllantysiliogogogochensis TaxID=2590453 RepID=A0A540WZ18_9BACT|nr:type II secretion system protein [Myxococcus llanfairpwllgwyngyllgogerychwyrndrobwllllantysiliogogogochensis]TQF14252.1 type II secretion system protein [Myxococcus llanfairpwllgwyngyllgogerychwyrndrobwllllantysiliogogogochensis]